MFHTCPFCGDSMPTHGSCCRVPGDLDRFERVYRRLSEDQANPFLQKSLLRYLHAFGRGAGDVIGGGG